MHHPDYIAENTFSDGPKVPPADYDKDVWELYNLNEDFNERIDLSEKYPEKLKELQALFDTSAKRYNIYPFIDWDDVFHGRIIIKINSNC